MIFRKHYLIIIIALCVGCLSSLPQYFAPRIMPQFAQIYRGATDDAIYYEARVKDVLDGHTYLSNPYLYEYKDGFPMQFWVPDYILAQGVQWLGVSVPVGFIIWTFFLVTILVLLTYSILYMLTESRRWSVLATTFLFLGLFPTTFIRLPSPGLNFVFWLLVPLFLLLHIHTHKTRYVFLSSVSFGLLFHIYPYYWTFYAVLLSLYAGGVFLNEHLHGERIVFSKKIIFIILGGFCIGIPYFISLFRSSQLPEYTETLARVGLINTHFPSGLDTVVCASCVVFLFALLYWKKIIHINTTSILLFSGVCATVIATNQHIITGKNLEFSSHYFLGNMVWLFISVMYLLHSVIHRYSQRTIKIIYVVLCGVVIVYACVGIQKLIAQQMTYTEGEMYFQNYAPVLEWLNHNAGKDDVVYSGNDLSYFIPVYTSLNVFYNPFSILFFMRNEEVKNRFILSHYFDSINRDHVLLRQRFVFGGYYINEYGHTGSKNRIRKLLGQPVDNTEMIPASVIDGIVAEAHGIQKNDLLPQLKKYKVDYIVWDSVKDPQWKVKTMKGLQSVYEANGIFVYKVI